MILFGKFLFALFDAIFFIRPLAQVNQFAALAAKRPKTIVGVPLMFNAAVRTGHNRQSFVWHHVGRLQKVRLNGTSFSTWVDFAA